MDKIVYLFGNKPDEEKKVENVIEEESVDYEIPDPAVEDERATLLKLGSDKESGILNATWDEIATLMNDLYRNEPGKKKMTESGWRKTYVRFRDEMQVTPDRPTNVIDFAPLSAHLREMEKAHVKQRDERMAYTRQIRSQARQDMILDMFRETIQSYPPMKFHDTEDRPQKDKAIYAMLSDIHFGLTFSSYVGEYNSEIAQERVLYYADNIVIAGKKEKADILYVSLMGDMVSGIIHQTVRVENKENIIQQIVGVSELTAGFLYYLSKHFKHVYVNSVDGNHSRLDPDLENCLRKEKLDSLIPWYCRAKLCKCDNIEFIPNTFDSTVGVFSIGSKLYASVHGDLEKDLKNTAVVLEKTIGRHVDYLLAGHMHVPEMRAEDTMYIRNGSVCGSGDDYTMKKRLFSPPYQVFMVISDTGDVESIHTVNLANVVVKDRMSEVG